MGRRGTLIGLGVGLAAAGATTAIGLAAEALVRNRQTALALDTGDPMDEPADEEIVVVADDGVVLHVEVDEPAGPPPPGVADVPTVVLSHGYCLSLRCWVFQRRAMTRAGYRVVLWDQRGHGKSGTGDKESYQIEQLGRDLARVIDQVAPAGPLVLIGHSMGGMTQMAYAVEHHDVLRERVVGAAFVATSPGGLSAVSWGLGSLLGRFVKRVGPVAVGQLATKQSLVDQALRAGKDVRQFLVDRYAFASPVPMQVVTLTSEMIFSTSMEVIGSLMPVFDVHDKREALAQFVGVETLVINGADDQLTPPDHSDEIVRLIPGAEHVVVADAGHVLMLEHPELVNEQLLGLLARATRSAAPHRGGARVRRTLTDLSKRERVRAATPARGLSARSGRSGRGGRPVRRSEPDRPDRSGPDGSSPG